MKGNQVECMIEDKKNELKFYNTRYREEIQEWSKYSCGIFWIDANLLQSEDDFEDKKVNIICNQFENRHRTLGMSDRVFAFKPSETDFRTSKTTLDPSRQLYGDKTYLIPVDKEIVKLKCVGCSNEVKAAQRHNLLFPVELFDLPTCNREKKSPKTFPFIPLVEVTYARQPLALRDMFCMLYDRRPRVTADQDWRSIAEFDIIITYMIPSSVSFRVYSMHKKEIKRLFSHDGIITQLKFLADECPFLWHGISLDNLSSLGPLAESCPEAIQNYLEHIREFWKKEILGSDIYGAMDTLSEKSVRVISGAFPLISRTDRERIASLPPKKTSPLLKNRLSSSRQRILTLRTFFKEVRLPDSGREMIAKFTRHMDKNVDKYHTSMGFIKDRIILTPQNTNLKKPSRISLKDNPRQYTRCMLWAMKNAGRSASPMAMKGAVMGFLDAATGSLPDGGDKGCAETTSFRWITAPGRGIWREIVNLSDCFNLNYLIDVYDEFQNKNKNQESDKIPASLLVWDTIRCFYTKPSELSSDQARSLRHDICNKIFPTSLDQSSSDSLSNGPGLTTASSSDYSSQSPPTPQLYSRPLKPMFKEFN